MTAFDTCLDSALRLPYEQRSQLAGRLLESLDDDMPVSDVWRTEIRRRAQEIDEGRVELLDHEEVMRQAQRELQAARQE